MSITSILALMVYSLLERVARQAGLAITARTLSEIFQDLRVVELSLAGTNNPRIRTVEDLSADQKLILEKLNLPFPTDFIRKIHPLS